MGILRIRDLDPLFSSIQYHAHHFTCNPSLHALRTAFMGSQTLVDLVAGIFTGVTDAINTVKHNLQTTWDGIKNAGSFVARLLIDSVMKSIQTMVSLFFYSFIEVINPLIFNNTISIQSISPLVFTYRGEQCRMEFNYTGGSFNIQVGSTYLSLNIMRLFNAEETLGGGLDPISRLMIGLYSIGIGFPLSQLMLIASVTMPWIAYSQTDGISGFGLGLVLLLPIYVMSLFLESMVLFGSIAIDNLEIMQFYHVKMAIVILLISIFGENLTNPNILHFIGMSTLDWLNPIAEDYLIHFNLDSVNFSHLANQVIGTMLSALVANIMFPLYSSSRLVAKATKTRLGMFFFQFFVTAIGVIYQGFVAWLYSVTIKLLKEGSQ